MSFYRTPIPPPQDHPGGVLADTGSQSITTSIERNTFGAGVDVAHASSVSPGSVRGPLVDRVDSGTDHDPDTVDRAAEQLVIEPVIAESNVGTADRAAEQSVMAESGVLVQGVGHDEFPVEEQIFDGAPCHSEVSLVIIQRETGPPQQPTEVAHSRDYPAVAVSRDLPAVGASRVR